MARVSLVSVLVCGLGIVLIVGNGVWCVVLTVAVCVYSVFVSEEVNQSINIARECSAKPSTAAAGLFGGFGSTGEGGKDAQEALTAGRCG